MRATIAVMCACALTSCSWFFSMSSSMRASYATSSGLMYFAWPIQGGSSSTLPESSFSRSPLPPPAV